MKKKALLAVVILSIGILSGCAAKKDQPEQTQAVTQSAAQSTENTKPAAESSIEAGNLKKLTVGASPAPHAEILEAARDELKQRGYDLKIVEYNDYVQPNLALSSGELDANYFQHLPYLMDFNSKNKTTLVSAAAIHYEPFGIYAGKTSSIAELKDGAKIAVPNDVTNEARALLLLSENGLITLKDNTDINATKNDITSNPKNIDIIETEAAQLPRSLQDVDMAVINGNYAISAGLKVSDALATEQATSVAATTYANIIAVREGDEKSEATLALEDALRSDTVKKFIEDKYAGAVVPIF